MIETYKKQYAPGCEEYGELCYYALLTHYKATYISELKYYFRCNYKNTSSCKFCNAVEKYSNSVRKAEIAYISMSVGKLGCTWNDYIPESCSDPFKRKREVIL